MGISRRPLISSRSARLVLVVVSLAAAALVAASLPKDASGASCGEPTTYAIPKKDRNVGWAPGVGLRAYSVGIASYLQPCGSRVTRARHQLYFDTRAFPHGYKFMFTVSTRRSDGRWQAVKSRSGASIFQFSGKREIQEVIVYQRRSTPGGLRLTRVHVKHCACSLGSGAVPASSTLKGIYKPYSGPEANPQPD